MAARAKKKKGFWDTPEAQAATQGSGKYLTATEKQALIDDGTVLEIVGVKFDEKNQYQGNPAPRYVVTFNVPANAPAKEGERFYGFAINEEEPSSRDNLLEALTDYLGTNGAEPVMVVLGKINNFVTISKAEV